LEGVAALDDTGPTSDAVPAHQATHWSRIAANGWTAASFARDHPQRIVITPARLRA